MNYPGELSRVVLFRSQDKEYLMQPAPDVFNDWETTPGSKWLHLTTTYPNSNPDECDYLGLRGDATSVPQRTVFIAMGSLVKQKEKCCNNDRGSN